MDIELLNIPFFIYRRKEADVLWRENLARLRIKEMESEIYRKQKTEKQKLFELEIGTLFCFFLILFPLILIHFTVIRKRKGFEQGVSKSARAVGSRHPQAIRSIEGSIRATYRERNGIHLHSLIGYFKVNSNSNFN